MKYLSLFVATIGVILVLFSLPAAGPTGAHSALQVTITPTAFNYLPFVAKNWPPTPTPTSTPSPTPTPTLQPIDFSRLLVLCQDRWTGEKYLRMGACSGEYAISLSAAGQTIQWATHGGVLGTDISGTLRYNLYLKLASGDIATIRMRIIHSHDGARDFLVSSDIIVGTDAPTPYSGVLLGPNPELRLGDKLILEIQHVSGGVVMIMYGDRWGPWPDTLSYIYADLED